jgi:hypothetical protein
MAVPVSHGLLEFSVRERERDQFTEKNKFASNKMEAGKCAIYKLTGSESQ